MVLGLMDGSIGFTTSVVNYPGSGNPQIVLGGIPHNKKPDRGPGFQVRYAEPATRLRACRLPLEP